MNGLVLAKKRNTMNRSVAKVAQYFFCALMIAVVSPSGRAQVSNTSSPLNGEWVAESISKNGKSPTEEILLATRLIFKDSELKIVGLRSKDHSETTRFELNKDEDPMQIDLIDAEKRRIAIGIVEVKKDTMRIALRNEPPRNPKSNDGVSQRPTSFDEKQVNVMYLKLKKRSI